MGTFTAFPDVNSTHITSFKAPRAQTSRLTRFERANLAVFDAHKTHTLPLDPSAPPPRGAQPYWRVKPHRRLRLHVFKDYSSYTRTSTAPPRKLSMGRPYPRRGALARMKTSSSSFARDALRRASPAYDLLVILSPRALRRRVAEQDVPVGIALISRLVSF